ncbi:hypothetical protein OB919_03600 [Halobacteria archaeon AArc-curdl1]|uniref:Uncharacterized protein n=1 Tax=Natronosalvus hydrolyticus TaxID=2979988 RepID=A0AAP2Z5S9_9EURY|nr:hypothetical protein [Halobacteria archaeon AArc-curdl1]
MNHLVPADDEGGADSSANEPVRWYLPQHAHIVVYERDEEAMSDATSNGAGLGTADTGSDTTDPDTGSDTTDPDTDSNTASSDSSGRGLLTIYDCGAAQKPPSAQLLGTLEAVDARAEIDRNPTGRVVSLREPSVLERHGKDRFRVVKPTAVPDRSVNNASDNR